MAGDDSELSSSLIWYYYVLFIFSGLSWLQLILFLGSVIDGSALSGYERTGAIVLLLAMAFVIPLTLMGIILQRKLSQYQITVNEKLNEEGNIPLGSPFVECCCVLYFGTFVTVMIKSCILRDYVEEGIADLLITLCPDVQWTQKSRQLLVHGSGAVLHATVFIFLLVLGEENFEMIVTQPFVLLWNTVKWLHRGFTQLRRKPTVWPEKQGPPSDHTYDSVEGIYIIHI